MVSEAQKLKVKKLLVDALRLRMDPAEIEDAAPLFGDGLGLDSVDAIELVTSLEQSCGAAIQNEEQARQAFASIDALTEYLVREGTLP